MRGTGDDAVFLSSADSELIGELIREYSDNLIRFAYCYLKDSFAAEDVAEEAFATLIFKKKNFSSRAAFKSYLYKTARSRCIDALRLRGRQTPLEDVENVLPAGDAERDAVKREAKAALYCCMQKLPKQYGEVLYLCYIDGFSIDEACHLLKKNKKQIYNLLARAKIALKTTLTEEGICYEDL